LADVGSFLTVLEDVVDLPKRLALAPTLAPVAAVQRLDVGDADVGLEGLDFLSGPHRPVRGVDEVLAQDAPPIRLSPQPMTTSHNRTALRKMLTNLTTGMAGGSW
jgi:hypothetical protein